jgi:uncharacterized membrane protein YoaK (UPF0700 family)
LATMVRKREAPYDAADVRQRASVTSLCLLGFAGGCVAGAVLELHLGLRALLLPVVLAVLAIPLGELKESF